MMLDGCGWSINWAALVLSFGFSRAVPHIFELVSSFKTLLTLTSTVERVPFESWDPGEFGTSNLRISQYITRCDLKITWISSGCQFSLFLKLVIIYFALGNDWRHLSTVHIFRENAFFLSYFVSFILSSIFLLLDSKHCIKLMVDVRMLWLILVQT